MLGYTIGLARQYITSPSPCSPRSSWPSGPQVARLPTSWPSSSARRKALRLRREGRGPHGPLWRGARRSSIRCCGVRPPRRTPAGWCVSRWSVPAPGCGSSRSSSFMFVALSTRLWFLQVLAGPQHERDARDNSLRTVTTDALRGDILDRDGRRLVHNRQSLEVRINRDELGDEAERRSRTLGDPGRLRPGARRGARLEARRTATSPSRSRSSCPRRSASRCARSRSGSKASRSSSRVSARTPGPLGAHLVGWVGQINAEEIRQRRFEGTPSDLVGKAGLEATYERWLRGTPGEERFLVNPTARSCGVRSEARPTRSRPAAVARSRHPEDRRGGAPHGHRERTDGFESSGKNLIANAGAVVVLDPKTGGIVAMASWPSFRPSWFVRGLTHGQRSLLFESEQAPMLNRATHHVRAGLDVQAVRRTCRGEGADRLVRQLLRLPGRVRAPGRRVRHGLRELERAERRHAVDRWRAQGLVRLQYYAWGSRFYERDLDTGQESSRAGCGSGASVATRSTSRRRRSGPFRTTSTSPSTTRVSGRLDPGDRHPARDRLGRDEGDSVAGRAGGRGARERSVVPAPPRGQDRGEDGEVARASAAGAGCSTTPRANSTTSARPPRCHDDRRDGGIGVRGVSARRLREDRDRRAPAVPGHVGFAGMPASIRSTWSWPPWNREGSGRRPPPRSSGTS